MDRLPEVGSFMIRVVFALAVLQALVPPGLCVHKLGVAGRDHDIGPLVVSEAPVPKSKCCQHRVPAGGTEEPLGHDDPSPTPDPCPAGFCDAQLDKAAPVGYVPANPAPTPFPIAPPLDPVGVRPAVPSRAVATASDPPRHVVFCTFLI